MKTKLKKMLKLHIATYVLVSTVAVILVSLFSAPVHSVSTDQCSSCHGSRYYQQLDILEGNSQNILPSSIQVGQALTVRVVLQNLNNAYRYTQLSSVSATLSSKNNHFSVSAPTYSIGSLPTGTATATWQITGTSEGSDQLIITTSAYNPHESITLTDAYAPNPTITVIAQGATPPPTPSPSSTPSPTSTTSPAETPTATSNPSPSPTAITTPPPTATAPTPTPTQPSSTDMPTFPTPTHNPNTSPTPHATNTTSHELNSTMLYIHPPLAIASYVFIFLFAAFVIKNNFQPKKVKIAGLTAWVLALLGLLTGMLWAQIAWGSYWSWDLKESLTLALFLSLTATQVAYFEKNQKATQWLSMITCALMLATALSSFIVVGLHSFL